ncbi:hypothetical protein BKI52_29380 [marine bacterium AO1-C]|nr:hypothetical protein BKI52_29380 [marine bacterium AO1-C]
MRFITHSLFLPLLLFFIAGLLNIQAQTSKKLTQRKDGKYILQLKGAFYLSYSKAKYKGKATWLRVNHIPIGSQVKIINPDNGKFIEINVTDSMAYPYDDYIAEVSYNIRQKLSTKGYQAQIVIEYITPIDQLLKATYDATNPDDKINRFKALLPVLERSLPSNPQDIPVFDSLRRFTNTLKTSRKKAFYPVVASFFEKVKPKYALLYLKALIQISHSENNLDKEAEYWLRLGNVTNALVDKEVVKQQGGSEALQDPQSVARQIAKKTGYAADDVIRWNWFGGHYPTNYLFYATPEFELFPHPEQFSDKEYLEYLKIKKAQKQPDQIAWGLKKLGDLYRLKTGYAKAEEYYLQMEKLRMQGNDKDKLAWTWGHLALFYWEQKKYDLAETYFNKIYQLRTEAKDYKRVIWALGGLRYMRYTQGKLDEALGYQRKILRFYEQLGWKNRGLLLYSVIENYLFVFPRKTQMIKNYLIKWANEYKNNPKMALKYDQQYQVITNKLVYFAEAEGKFEQAAEYMQHSIPVIKDSTVQLSAINDVAFYYQKAKNYRKSLKFYKLGLKKAKQIPNKLYEGLQYYKIGYYYDVLGKTKKALKQFGMSVKAFKNTPDDSSDDYRNQGSIKRAVKFLLYQAKYREVVIQLMKEFVRITKDPYDKASYKYALKTLQKK